MSTIWGFELPDIFIDDTTKKYLNSLPDDLPNNEWLWKEMDRVWCSFDLNNKKPLLSQPIAKFYSHPIWLVNGVFSAIDPTSISHREAIANYVAKSNVQKIADYGGGFAELAIQISFKKSTSEIHIIEPFPTEITKTRTINISNIQFKNELEEHYDCIIAQDVLEHLGNPIDTAYQIAKHTNDQGIIIFANCFYPIIKCHLPSTFHLRHTFPLVMKAMGLKYIGTVTNAEHAQIYQKVGNINFHKAKTTEVISKPFGFALNFLYKTLLIFKRFIKK